jgi:hypothetical protein
MNRRAQRGPVLERCYWLSDYAAVGHELRTGRVIKGIRWVISQGDLTTCAGAPRAAAPYSSVLHVGQMRNVGVDAARTAGRDATAASP